MNDLGMMAGMMAPCAMLEAADAEKPDGVFGAQTAWRRGAGFEAVIVKRSSTEQKIAERRDRAEIFDVCVEAGCAIGYGDAFVREADGQAFRVTSAPVKAPAISTVQILTMTAERWEVPKWAETP